MNTEDFINCPRILLQPLLEVTEDLQWSEETNTDMCIFLSTPRSLGISEYASAPMYGKLGKPVELTYRVERFKLLQHPEELELFDTIYNATTQGKGPAEVMLEMLATSMRR